MKLAKARGVNWLVFYLRIIQCYLCSCLQLRKLRSPVSGLLNDLRQDFFKYLQIVYSDPGSSPISMDQEHHFSYPIRRRSEHEGQAQAFKSCYKSFKIILVSTGCRKISQNLLLQYQME